MTFAPGAAERVFEEMIANESNIRVYSTCQVTMAQLNRTGDGGRRVVSFATTAGGVVNGRAFVDASYEGDLMAACGVSAVVGREAAVEYNETAAGRQATPPVWHCGANWNWGPVDGRDAATGQPLPMVSRAVMAPPGGQDATVQAYCFRLCMTTNTSGAAFVPFPAPLHYDPMQWELLRRAVNGTSAGLADFFILSDIGGGKTDTNNGGGLSTDMVGGSHEWPTANYSHREQIFAAHKDYTLGLFHFLRTDSAVPAKLRAELSPWGLCGGEFISPLLKHWPHQLYVREARRMRGPFVFTQADRVTNKSKPDSIAVGAYNLDAHVNQRVILRGSGSSDDSLVTNEGCLSGFATYHGIHLGEFEIPYRVLLPPAMQVTNLLVSAAVSATHVGFASLRLEPQFMGMGEAAGLAAHLVATANASTVQEVSVPLLQDLLQQQGVRIRRGPSPPPPSSAGYACGLT